MNSNSHALAAQLRAAGAEPVDLGIAADTADSVREALDRAIVKRWNARPTVMA